LYHKLDFSIIVEPRSDESVPTGLRIAGSRER
jgi:hypothetical protein